MLVSEWIDIWVCKSTLALGWSFVNKVTHFKGKPGETISCCLFYLEVTGSVGKTT